MTMNKQQNTKELALLAVHLAGSTKPAWHAHIKLSKKVNKIGNVFFAFLSDK